MRNSKIVLLVAGVAVHLIAGVGSRSASVNVTDQNMVRRNAAENIFLSGKAAERGGDTVTALQAYSQAWKLDSASDFLTQYAAEFALQAGEPGQAIYIMSGGASFSSLPDEKLRFMAGIYIRYQHYVEALQVYKELDSLDKNDSIIYANLLAEDNYYYEAAQILQKTLIVGDSITEIKVADLYRRAGKLEKAESLFSELLLNYPENRSVSKGLGLTLLATGAEQRAMALLRKFLPVAGGEPDAQVVELVGRYYASRGLFGDAIELFQFLYKGDGSSRDFYYGRPLSIYAFLDRRFEYAETVMTDLLKINDQDYELLFLLGSVNEALGETNTAIENYDAALEVNPKFEDALRSRVLIYARRGDADEAIRFVEEYTQKIPESIDAWALHGSLLTMEKRFSEALMPLRKAVELSGDDPAVAVLFELGMSLERTGDIRGAEKVFSQILRIDGEHAPTANYLGYMWAERGVRLDKAEKLILTALEKDPENGAYLDSYGWVLYQKGEYENALLNLEKALLSISNDYVIYYHMAFVLEKLGRYSDAVARFREAEKFENPQSGEILRKISELEKFLKKDNKR